MADSVRRPFRRLAIVNRGEPAMRVIHAVRELNAAGDEAIRLIALYTEPERQAMFVRHADEAVCLGPATVIDARDGRRRSGYLDEAALEAALVAARADAAWVGWGLVAEHPRFAELCERLGIVFVGPDAGVMRRLGDKIQAKRLAEEAGVPVALWSGGPVDDVREAEAHAQRIGFPLMVKAAAGGGGRGMRRVDTPDALAGAFDSARSEAQEAFGDGTVLLEKVVTPARHIEVQIIADGQGTAWAAGVRDCSLQRGNQKVIEESAGPALTPEQDGEVREAAVRLALRAGYANAGTVEFLYEPATGRVSFMEVNVGLQVEHAVTEVTTGVDLVKLQLHVAAGGTLEGDAPVTVGHAVEARLNAEDPALGFAPAPGRIALLRLPSGPGVRVDSGFAQGDVIPAEFDSMIAKVIAWGADRREALARLHRALGDTVVVVEGGTTNQGFLLDLVDRPEVRAGEYDTTWLDALQVGAGTEPARHADVALLAAAVELGEAETAADRARFLAFARRGRPQADARTSRTVELRHRGQGYRFGVSEVDPRRYRVTVDGVTVEAEVDRLNAYERRLIARGDSFRTVISGQGPDLLVEVDGVPHHISRDDGGMVRNPAPAVVVALPVAAGDVVAAGAVVAVVEAMKMETSLVAPFRGRVRRVLVAPNVQVGAQEALVQLEALDEPGAVQEVADRVSLGRLAAPPPSEPPVRCHENLRRLEWLVLGYDCDDAEVRRLIEDLHGACRDLLSCDPALIPGEHRLLETYAEVHAVARLRHDGEDVDAELVRSPQEHLFAFLRSMDAEAEGLPAAFVADLERALAHYGVAGLERTPALEEACHRLFLAHERAGSARAAVVAVLDRRLEQADELTGRVGDGFRAALDRLAAAAESRDRVVADLAHENRYRYVDEPVIAAASEEAYGEMEAALDALAADPGRPDRDRLVSALVACPRPMAVVLSRRMRDAAPALRRVLLEAMTRRYYRTRLLEGFDEVVAGDHAFLTARYADGEGRRHLATAFVDLDELPAAAHAFAGHVAALPDEEQASADFYAEQRGGPRSHQELAATLRAALAGVDLPPAVRRVVIAVSGPDRGRGMGAVDLFTFRPGADGPVEDLVLRGLHPMMAERLQLWRLTSFALERLPCAEDVYLFHGVAHENPKDERLFALAEVRDLTPVRDAEGRVTALPELERMLVAALEGIRRFQAHRPPSRRLQWNRILLHAWRPIELAPDDIARLVGRLGPITDGLGIEMLLVRGRLRDHATGTLRDRVLRFFTAGGREVLVEVDDPPTEPLAQLDEGARRIVAARRRGTVHPAEIVKLLVPGHAGGAFVEHDLDDAGRLVAVDRPPAHNEAGIVAGLIRNVTERHPDGMLRVALLGDPTKAMGSLAEPECTRIIAALDVAEELGVPLEWFALSAGAKIAMDSGTENMDWVAAVLRRIVEFTQRGGEINVVVTGINVGAQPYWNAEATMLMHTRGILVMTPDSAMVLTGKQALDYAGGVSAEDNFGIGGYERIMGPNGQAQYWAPDVTAACRVLLAHYAHTYVVPGERFPRRSATADPPERDVRDAPHLGPGSDLARVGDIFANATNPGRRKPFDIRSVMRATIDADHPPLERWGAMHDADTVVVWDAHLGGWPIALLGIESRPLPRFGVIPADGPEQWTPGTLFPRSAKKAARAINAAAGRRPLVVLANLAGFDGSPESLRKWQLEFGAEIGRAVVNFDGPIVFCVVSRYHGGAFVVFSQRLNEQLVAIALEGAHASVIGGAPAAAVVFGREVDAATRADPQIAELDERIARAEGAERQRLRARRDALWPEVRNRKRGEFAARFDEVHSVQRAVGMGSVSEIIPAASLRPHLLEAVERGMRRALDRDAASDGRPGLADPLAR